ISFMADLTQKSVEVARKLNDLNLQLTQDVLGDYYQASRQIAAGDPATLPNLMANPLGATGERLRRYQEQLMHVLGGGNIDLARYTPWLLPAANAPAGTA
ncbi:MAG: hypothetical protein ACLGI6_20665, partial [Gammaproteobacteria bacterium]